MSATTPALRGGIGNQLGTALAAIALAVLVIAALIGLQAVAGRNTAATPAVAPAPAPAVHDRGWATDDGTLAVPAVEAPNGGHGTRMAQ